VIGLLFAGGGFFCGHHVIGDEPHRAPSEKRIEEKDGILRLASGFGRRLWAWAVRFSDGVRGRETRVALILRAGSLRRKACQTYWTNRGSGAAVAVGYFFKAR